MCKSNILGSNTLYSIYPKDDKYDLKFLLACLNSSFIKRYWQAKYSDNKALFPKIKGFQLKELPIPIANHETQTTIVKIVNKVLETKETDATNNTEDLEKQIDEIIDCLYNS